jgi:hypothetical protein
LHHHSQAALQLTTRTEILLLARRGTRTCPWRACWTWARRAPSCARVYGPRIHLHGPSPSSLIVRPCTRLSVTRVPSASRAERLLLFHSETGRRSQTSQSRPSHARREAARTRPNRRPSFPSSSRPLQKIKNPSLPNPSSLPSSLPKCPTSFDPHPPPP